MTGTRKLAILAPLKAWGGIERKLVTLCKEFVKHDVHPQLLLTRGGQIPYPEDLPADVEVIDLGSRGKRDGVLKFARYLKQQRPDAVLTAKDHSAKVAIVARALTCPSCPVFVKVTNTLSQTLRRPVKRSVARLLYPHANRLIAVSHGVRDDLIEHFRVPADRIDVIYNPTVTECIHERARQPVDHPWFNDPDTPLILGVGRLTPQKDFASLIRAFAILRAERPARLVILGDGPLRETLRALARDLGVAEDVDLPGYAYDPIPYMARASVFALSSRYEGLANVIIEALAAGAPVVSTDCPSGPREILQGPMRDALVPVGDSAGLANALLNTLRCPPPLEARRAGLDRFRSDQVAKRYLRTMGLL